MTRKLLKSLGLFGLVQRAYILARRQLELIGSRGITSSRLVISVHAGDRPEKASDLLCLFASHDVDSKIDDYVLFYLSELKRQLSADIVFVTTSDNLDAQEVDKIRPYCRTIIHRQNRSMDFGSWKAALDATQDWKEYRTLVLANDSVYGPFSDLRSAVARLGSDRPTLLGVTENKQYRRHLQSYFLVFNDAAIHSDFFRRFWASFKFVRSKKVIIHELEIGITRQAEEAGFETIAIFPYENLLQTALQEKTNPDLARLSRLGLLNPVHHLWKELLHNDHAMFLKVELLKANPHKVPNLESVKAEIEAKGSYPFDLIRNHLQRTSNRFGASPHD